MVPERLMRSGLDLQPDSLVELAGIEPATS